MGLDIPTLDDREFEEVFEEVRRKIPIYSDDWSDHNAHDTGIAILEMLTWVTETYTYQLDQITDTHREKYLKLLGVERRAPRPASTHVAVTPPPGVDSVSIDAGEKLIVDDRSGVDKTFEIDETVTITPSRIETVITHAGGDTVDNTTENEIGNTRFLPFGDDPSAGDAVYLGFDTDPFDGTDVLSLACFLYEQNLPDPVPIPETGADGDGGTVPWTGGDETDATGATDPTDTPEAAGVTDATGATDPIDTPDGIDFTPSVSVAWEYCTSYADWEDDDAWEPLPVLSDETNAFYRSGVVTIDDPGWNLSEVGIHDGAVFGQSPGLIWIRCRLDRAGYEFPPQFSTVRTNVVPVSHRSTVTNERLKRGDGGDKTTIEANQTFYFEHAPVLEATIVVDGERWTEVDDFDTSGPTSNHYVLDETQGSITFGDGRRGGKPPVGEAVVAERYVHGGGEAGNVSTASAWEFARESATVAPDVRLADLSIAPLQPATGGADAESIDDVMERFKHDLKRPYRAVTLSDYEFVATHTPGLRFGRAKATTTERTTRLGDEITEVTVVVVPYSTDPKPMPSDAFLDAVREHVDRSRLLTDSIRVEPPTYVDVGMDIVVSGIPGRSEQRLLRRVREALLEFVHPIIGFDGNGWPFGRPLYVSEVIDVVEAVGGIEAVHDVSITAAGHREMDDHGNVLIDESALPALIEGDLSVTTTTEANRSEGRP